jgi:hypothetical protein
LKIETGDTVDSLPENRYLCKDNAIVYFK